jgi:two-component SAPR family response regulator
MTTSNSKSIMVVDDERDIAALEHFSSGCKDHHIVISDIRMPGMNRYEFVKQVKKIDSQVKIILMSSFERDDNNLLDVLPDVKIDTFLQKPFSLDILTNIVTIPS